MPITDETQLQQFLFQTALKADWKARLLMHLYVQLSAAVVSPACKPTQEGRFILLLPVSFFSLSVKKQDEVLEKVLLHLLLGHSYKWTDFSDIEKYRWACAEQLQHLLLQKVFLPLSFFYKKTNQPPKELPNARFWQKVDPALQKVEIHRLQKQLQRAQQPEKGGVPLAFETYLTAVKQPAVSIPWQRILRQFVGRHAGSRLQHSLRRPSRRYGTWPGVKVQPLARLALIVDTSASISDKLLQRFFQEIHRLHQLGCRFTILEADVMVQRRYAYRGQRIQQLRGRGGTAFDHAIEMAEQELRPAAILYFTDARGPKPIRWKGTPLLWIIHGTARADHLPGLKISI